MIMAEQQSYNYALGSNNITLACMKLRGIAGMIPSEYKPSVPEMPEEVYKIARDFKDNVAVMKWLDKWQAKIFADVNRFIEESYQKGELEGEL